MFPLDWNEWREQWRAYQPALTKAARVPQSLRVPKNFMADEILGFFSTPVGTVELSEVRFCGRRGIGITIADPSAFQGRRTPERGVVHSFAELEEELGLREREESA